MSLRVLHVLDHSWPVLDGYAQRSRSIISAQAAMGMQPTALTSPLHQADDPSASDSVLDGIRYFRTFPEDGVDGRFIRSRTPVLREVAIVRRLKRRVRTLIHAEAFDIVHAHSPALCGRAALSAAAAEGVPCVYELRAFWEDAGGDDRHLFGQIKYGLSRSLETGVVRKAGAVVGIARAILGDLESRGISSNKLFHVPNGVDVARFTPRPRDQDLAAKLGAASTPTLGFIGTFFPWEGVAWLVRASAALRQRGQEFKLLIVGDGAEAPDVRRAIQETASAEYVSFLGRVPHEQVERYYSVMDVLVYPRQRLRITELVTPLKPLEAMALGKAVMGSDVGGIKELIDDDETGLLFRAGNVEHFCNQAARLLRDFGFRQKLGDAARKKICAERDWKSLVRRYEDAYSYAIRAARRRS